MRKKAVWGTRRWLMVLQYIARALKHHTTGRIAEPATVRRADLS